MRKRAIERARAHAFKLLVAGAACLTSMTIPEPAEAASALVRWLPGASSSVTGYSVYARNAGASYGTSPVWSGNPTPAADGTLSTVVSYTASPNGTKYFVVVAVNAGEESKISQELPIGTPNRCRVDMCTSKTTCVFADVPDGTACDDGSFCNGPEVCIAGTCDASQSRNCADAIACTTDACDDAAGRCTHVGPPGCCIACDSLDPCLVEACEQGYCSAPAGAALEIGRVKLVRRLNDTVKLVARGRFDLDPAVDPAVPGVVIEFRTTDGTLVYRSGVPGGSIVAGATGGRYRYTASRLTSEIQGNGVNRLDFRIKGTRWLVTIMGETERLAEAAAQSDLTIALRIGDACFRRMDMICNQKPGLAICR